MIQVKNLSKHYGDQVIFDSVSFQLGSRERVGLVGRNGSGKSTMFKLLLGQENSSGGEISIPKNYQIGNLSQHIEFSHDTVREECLSVLSADDYREHEAMKILFGLGFTDSDMAKNPRSFSGGYQIRINLTKALLKNPNLLLLDEPTNYLDIVSMRWLKNFLIQFPGELILITHDRDFMDEVVTHVMGLHRKKLKKIKGDTAKFYEKILEEEEIYEKTRENLDKKKKEMQEFIERFKAKASKAKQAQSRMKSLDKMQTLDKLSSEENLGFKFKYVDCPAKIAATINHLAFAYEGTEVELFSNLNFNINKNDRIGIIGKNGKGKSTLLNIIAGHLSPTSGKVSFHPAVNIGHFGQTNINRLNLEKTIAEEIQGENGDLSISSVRNICGTMMFEGDAALKKIKVLSGGERARVMLGKILAREHNLLLLDEPTNHLDLESIESLTDEIINFEGAVVMVTHSELMLKNIANKLIVFQHNNAIFFEGSYDEFLDKIGWESEEAKVAPSKDGQRNLRELRARLTIERAKIVNPIKEKIAQLESDILKNEDLVKRITDQLIRPEVMNDATKLSDFTHAIGKLNQQIEESFDKLSKENDELLKWNEHYDLKQKSLED